MEAAGVEPASILEMIEKFDDFSILGPVQGRIYSLKAFIQVPIIQKNPKIKGSMIAARIIRPVDQR